MTNTNSNTLFKTLLGLCLLWVFSCGNQDTYDVLILNGSVYDGKGGDPIVTDIAIKDSMIVTMGELDNAKADKIIDASGLAVSPGFIDMHTHIEPIMELNSCESHVRQGVTTSLGGPDGSSPYPLKPYMDSLQQKGVGMNVAYLVGHNTIRRNIMGLEDRAPTEEELKTLKPEVWKLKWTVP